MIKTATLTRDQKPTAEQIKQIQEAAKREIVYDDDSPELTPAMEKAFDWRQRTETHIRIQQFHKEINFNYVKRQFTGMSGLAFLC